MQERDSHSRYLEDWYNSRYDRWHNHWQQKHEPRQLHNNCYGSGMWRESIRDWLYDRYRIHSKYRALYGLDWKSGCNCWCGRMRSQLKFSTNFLIYDRHSNQQPHVRLLAGKSHDWWLLRSRLQNSCYDNRCSLSNIWPEHGLAGWLPDNYFYGNRNIQSRADQSEVAKLYLLQDRTAKDFYGNPCNRQLHVSQSGETGSADVIW